MKRLMQSVAVLAAVMVLTTGATASDGAKQAQTMPDVLKHVPADAPVTILVPSLGALSNRVATMNQSMGLNMPFLADPFNTLLGMTGAKAVNRDGSFAAVMTALPDLDHAGPDMQAPFVLLVPVTDYKQFAAGWGGKGDGIERLEIPGLGETAYVRQVGAYALVGPLRDTVAQFKTKTHKQHPLVRRAGGLGRHYIATSDASAIVNMEMVGKWARPKLDEAVKEQTQMMEMALGKGPMDDLVRGMFKTFAGGADAVLRDGRAAVYGVNIDRRGAAISFAIQFDPKSETGKLLGKGRPAAPILTRLPNRPYVFAGAANIEGIDIKGLSDAIWENFPKADGENTVIDLLRTQTAMMSRVKSSAQVVYLPRGSGIGGTMFAQANLIETSDARRFVNEFDVMTQRLGATTIDLGLGEGNQMKFKASFKRNEHKIDGVDVHVYEQTPQLPPALTAQMGPMGAMLPTMMTTRGLVAAKGDYVIVTTNEDTGLVRDVLDALDKKDGLGQDHLIQTVRGLAMPPNACMEAYINMGSVVEMINMVLTMPGVGMPPIDAPKNMPPLAMGMSVEDGGLAYRVYAPTPILRFGATAVQNAMRMQEGQGQNGNGGDDDDDDDGDGDDVPPAPTY